MLVVLGAVGYGSSNVAQEFLVRRFPILDFIGLLGIFGSVIAGVQFLCLEKAAAGAAFKLAATQPLIWLWYALFAVSMYAVYTAMPYVLSRTSAVVVNLNLLTADVYALVVGLFLFKYHFHWLYFVAYSAIMLGVCLYVAREPRITANVATREDGASVGFVAKLLCWRRREREAEDGPAEG